MPLLEGSYRLPRSVGYGDLVEVAHFITALWIGINNGSIIPDFAQLYTSVINDRAKRQR